MKLEACRDCGALVPAHARGCPQCARNLEAERMLARYFWLGVVPLLLLLLGLGLLLTHNK
jgi:RNA polymerase subunit RPABC4/transcription elongation factor Spt4